jgi:hypothetical protein
VKWVALIITLAAIIPLSGWLRRNPRASPKLWMLMGFLPFVVTDLHLYMAIDSWADWGGYVKGAEFSILDVLALAVCFSLPGGRHPLPFRFSMALYFLATLLSAVQAEQPVAALFYPWQLARMFLVYAAVTRAACADPRVAPALMKGMAAALFMETGVSIWQRFALGVLQTGGTVGHQNLLGLLSHLIVFPFFGLLVAGSRGSLPPAVVLAGVIIQVLTTSRATIGIAGLGYAAVFFLCGRRWTPRKTLVLLSGVVMIAILAPLAVSSFERRQLANDEASSDSERAAYIKAAALIFSDNPLGIGANHFAVAANLMGYYDKAGVPSDSDSRAGNVHNIYWLVAAETGFPGLITLVLLLLNPLPVAFLCGWRYRGDQRGDLLLGLGVGLSAVYIHSFFEWSLVTFQAQYMIVLAMGLVAGIAQQLGYWRPAQARRISLEASGPVNSTSKSFGNLAG